MTPVGRLFLMVSGLVTSPVAFALVLMRGTSIGDHDPPMTTALARGKLDCLLHGWEKPDCLALDGCAWCDTSDYGGACVTAQFASKVKEWSWIECTKSMVESARTGAAVELGII